MLTNEQLAQTLDAAVLKPELSPAEADAAVRQCVELSCKTACVRPVDVERAKAMCVGTATGVCAVVGFPHGANLPGSKADETRRLVELGADEIDVVVHYGAARGGDFAYVRNEVEQVVAAADGRIVKTIFETSELDPALIAPLVEAAAAGGAAFVKTSTGFASGGATEDVVRAMLDAAADRVQVKPSGGIRDRATAEKYSAMGATRLGVGWTTAAALLGEGGTAGGGGY